MHATKERRKAGVIVRVDCYLKPWGDLAVKFVFEGPPGAVGALFARGFPYTVLFQRAGDGEKQLLDLEVVEDLEGSTVWRTDDSRMAREALARVVERGGFEEECEIVSDGLSNTRRHFRSVSRPERRMFREGLEASLNVCS